MRTSLVPLLLSSLLLLSLAHAHASPAPSSILVDVTAFGAVGDGKTDCTAAVGEAAATLLANPGGGTLYFPQGTFLLAAQPKLSAYIELAAPKGLPPAVSFVVAGSGAQSTVLLWSSASGSLLSASGGLSATLADLSLYEIPAGPDAKKISAAVVLSGVVNSAIQGVNMQLDSGVALTIDGDSRNILVRSLFVNGTGTGVQLQDCADVLLTGCIFVGDGGPQAYDAVEVWANVTALRISDMLARGLQVGVEFDILPSDNNSSVWISHAAFTDMGVAGVHVGPQAPSITIANTLFNRSEAGAKHAVGAGVAVTRNDGLAHGAGSAAAAASAASIPAAARVFIEQCEFVGLEVGVHSEGGLFTISHSAFVNSSSGFWFQPSRDRAGEGRAPFALTRSIFSQITGAPARVQGGNSYVFTDNQCLHSEAASAFVCDGKPPACVIDNNPGCKIIN